MNFSWSKISLDKYATLHTLYGYDATDKIQQDISALSVITGKPDRYFETCALSKLSRYRSSLHKLLGTQIKQSKITKFRIGLTHFHCPDGIEFYFGEHLENVSLLRINQSNLVESYPKLLAVIASDKKDLPYNNKVELFNKLPAEIGVSICDRFLSQLGEVAAKYDTTSEVKQIKTDQPPRPDFRKQTVSMFEHWGYFHVFFELSGRDRTKMDYWRKQTIPYIFNSMAHRKDLQDEE